MNEQIRQQEIERLLVLRQAVGVGVKSLLVSGNKWQLADSSTEELSRKFLEPARRVELLTC